MNLLDLRTVLKASHAIASEINLDNLLAKLMEIVLENAGAQSGVLLLNRDGKLFIEAARTIASDKIVVRQSIPVEESNLPHSIINYVNRTQKDIVLIQAYQQGKFINDPYIIANHSQSILCTPILGQGKFIGILYLENNLIAGAFTQEQTQLLKLLCSQAAISLENAQLYEAQKEHAKTLEQQVQQLQQTQIELRQSEERYRSLVIATSKMVWIWMTDAQGRAYDIPALREYTGQTLEEVKGWGWLDALHPEDRDRSAQIWTQAVESKSVYETEYRLRGADGNYRYFSARGVAILAEDSSIREWMGICADIHDRKQAEIALQKANEELEFRVQERTAELQRTLEQLQQEIVERQQAEEKLRQSEARWQLALHGSNDGIWDWCNLNAKEVFYSPRYKEMLGYEDHEMENNYEAWSTRLHPDERDLVLQAFNDHLEGKTSFYTIELRLRCKDSNYKWFLSRGRALWGEDGKPIRITGSMTDITERKQAELALRESEERYRRIIETTYEGVWMIDAQGKTTFVNARMAQMLGYTVEAMLGKHIFEFMDEEGVAIATTDLERRRQGIDENHDFKFRRRDGSALWAIVATTSIFESDGEYVGALAMVTDISDRKQAEAALQTAKEAADAASRAKGEFLSKMSHELRTPLNAILGFTQVLARSNNLTAQQQEQLGIINNAGEHLLTLINDVLEMSKIEAGRLELHENSFDLYRLLDSLEEMFKFKAESKGLQLIFQRTTPLPQSIKTDETKFRQVLLNLLSNAIKFTEKGKITLRVAAKTNSEFQGDNSANQPQFLQFEIEDTGMGIAPEELKTLFDPFVQTEAGKKSQSGTGLGLPISRQFVQLMGGNLTLKSTLGQGTIFQFDIAIKPAHPTEISLSESIRKVVALEPNQPTYRILVVDDIWESRLLLCNLLSPLGFEVLQAANGQEAISIWQEWQPHLIWMDMQMPILDGYETTKQIKAKINAPKTIIIGLTASAFEENRTEVLAAGCDDFVSKPFRNEVIFEKISNYLGIRYLYEAQEPEQNSPPTSTLSAAADELKAIDLAIMPNEWIAQLYQAASALDEELIAELLEEIPPSNAELANHLKELSKKLWFDKIINLIQKNPMNNLYE